MSRQARITGTVVYREGDGPNITIRTGPCEFTETVQDATISWTEGDTRGSTAIPLNDFKRYVATGAIEVMAETNA